MRPRIHCLLRRASFLCIRDSQHSPRTGTRRGHLCERWQLHTLAARRATGRSFAGRSCRIGPPLSGPFRPRGCESFAVATLVDEVALRCGDLTIEKVVGLVYQADHRVSDHGRVSVVQPFRVARNIRLIRPIGPIPIPHLTDRLSLPVVFSPLPQTPLSQEILIVEQQLIQTRPRHVHQAQFRLSRGGRCPAALGDILPSAARRLHHLVHSA